MSDPIVKFAGDGNPFGLNELDYNVDPIFVDIDNDSDLDAFIGDMGGDSKFFKNTGTANNPVFSNQGDNPFGLSSVTGYASPTFVDIDGDNDQDGFIGNNSGNRQFSRNIGTPNNPIFASPETNPFGVPTVSYFATPEIVDIDSDGDLDAFISNQFHYMAFLVNRGLLTASTSGNDNLNGTMPSNDTGTYASATSEVTVSLLTTTQQDTIGAGWIR